MCVCLIVQRTRALLLKQGWSEIENRKVRPLLYIRDELIHPGGLRSTDQVLWQILRVDTLLIGRYHKQVPYSSLRQPVTPRSQFLPPASQLFLGKRFFRTVRSEPFFISGVKKQPTA